MLALSRVVRFDLLASDTWIRRWDAWRGKSRRTQKDLGLTRRFSCDTLARRTEEKEGGRGREGERELEKRYRERKRNGAAKMSELDAKVNMSLGKWAASRESNGFTSNPG